MNKILKINIKEKTLDQIDNLKNRLKCPSYSEVVRRSIGLNSFIVDSLTDGFKLYIENENEKIEIIIPGVK